MFYMTDSASLLLGRDLEDIENNYYQNFEYFLSDQDADPYFYTGDFKKKQSAFNFEDDSDLMF